MVKLQKVTQVINSIISFKYMKKLIFLEVIKVLSNLMNILSNA